MSDAIPNLGTLLAPYLSAVPAASMPRFLARLERGAADRYRYWASVLPAHAPGLLECAAREDEIARRADALFAVIAEDLPAIEAALPQARSTYRFRRAPSGKATLLGSGWRTLPTMPPPRRNSRRWRRWKSTMPNTSSRSSRRRLEHGVELPAIAAPAFRDELAACGR